MSAAAHFRTAKSTPLRAENHTAGRQVDSISIFTAQMLIWRDCRAPIVSEFL